MHTASSSRLGPNYFLQFKLKKFSRPYYKHSLLITYRQVCRPYVYLGLNKTYGMQSIQKCCYPLVFKNANNKCSDWRIITDISCSCLNLPTMQCTSCYFFSKLPCELLQQGLSIIEDNNSVYTSIWPGQVLRPTLQLPLNRPTEAPVPAEDR